jgi:hypothetical protein
MATEKFCLRWNDFESNIRDADNTTPDAFIFLL